jgi:hypothetical protein
MRWSHPLLLRIERLAQNSPTMEDIPPEVLKAAFDKAQTTNNDAMNYSPDEQEKFKKAFDDPEFRKMFSEYMEDLQVKRR